VRSITSLSVSIFPLTKAESLDELADNLKEALALHLEDEDLSEFDLAPNPSILASFELESLSHA